MSGGSQVGNEAKNLLTTAGYTVVGSNLNSIYVTAPYYAHYIFMGVKTSTKIEDAIGDLMVMKKTSSTPAYGDKRYHDEAITVDDHDYYLVNCIGDFFDTDHSNLNRGTGSSTDDIYLYYSRRYYNDDIHLQRVVSGLSVAQSRNSGAHLCSGNTISTSYADVNSATAKRSSDYISFDEYYVMNYSTTDEKALGITGDDILVDEYDNYGKLVVKGVPTTLDSRFKGKTTLTHLDCGDKVKTIADNAFEGCTSLERIRPDEQFETIGNEAFKNCTKYEVAYFNNAVSIGDYAFQNCGGYFATFDLPLRSIGKGCFDGCKLTNISLRSLPDIGQGAFPDGAEIEVSLNPSSYMSPTSNIPGAKRIDFIKRYNEEPTLNEWTVIALPFDVVDMQYAFLPYAVEGTKLHLETVKNIPAHTPFIFHARYNEIDAIYRKYGETQDVQMKQKSNSHSYCNNEITLDAAYLATNINAGTFSLSGNKMVKNGSAKTVQAFEGWITSTTGKEYTLSDDSKMFELVIRDKYQQYDGTEKKPSVTVILRESDTELSPDYYTVSYENNVKPSNWEAYAVVTFKGSYAAYAPIRDDFSITCDHNFKYTNKGDGEKHEAKCSICGQKFDEWHNYGEYVDQHDATCTANGHEVATCVCGDTDSREMSYSKLGHDWSEYASDNDATCTADGHETKHCKRSGCSETDNRVATGSKLEHVFTNYVYNNDATTKADGTETAVCDYGCGTTDKRTAEGTKLLSTAIVNTDAGSKARVKKYIENGMMIIERDGVKYDITGRRIE